MKDSLKKYAFGILSGATSLAVLLVFGIANHGLADLTRIILSARGRWVLAAVGCMAAFWLCEAIILHIFTLHLFPKYRFVHSLYNMMIGQLYNALTPFSTGGQVVQVVAMGKTGMTVGASTAVLAMRTLVYHVVLAVYAVIAMVIAVQTISVLFGALWLLIVIGLTANVGVALAMALVRRRPHVMLSAARWIIRLLARMKIVINPEKRLEAVEHQIALFRDSSLGFGRSPWGKTAAYLISFLQATSYFSITYCIYRSFWYNQARPELMVAIQSIVSMVSAFVPLPGGSGGAEGSFALMFGTFFNAGDLVPAVLLWRLITYYSCILVGGIVAVLGNRIAAPSVLTAPALNVPDQAAEIALEENPNKDREDAGASGL